MSFLGQLSRQEHAVEREAAWGITKVRVDGGSAIDVSEASVAVTAVGVERAEACLSYEELFFKYGAKVIKKYLKC